MPSDLTRPYGDPPHYKAVVMQQGRVILDRDFNALQDLIDRRIAADALDEIGPCGTPDDGLAISLPSATESHSVSASHWRPRPWDFLIKPGIMYVGGQRVVFDTPPSSSPPLSYFQQPDWANPPEPFAHTSTSHSAPPHEFIYLHAYEQEVGGVEDPDLLDVALGGPDTSQRVRLMRRIVRLGVSGTDCASALADAIFDWGQDGYLFDPATMRLLPQVRLQVGFTSALSTSNPCDPVAQGGYLGAENQLIRVMIHDPGKGGSNASLLWGYDNASFLYRISNVDPTGKILSLSQPPVDVFHNPSPNQVVEVLRTAMVLGTEADQTDPTGQRTIVRCLAEKTGFVGTVSVFQSGDNTLTLNETLPTDFTSDSNPLFLRVWVGRQSFDLSSTAPIVLTDPTPKALSPGLQVTITQPTSAAKGATLPAGAFWLFAVRPSTPQALYPERFLNAPQPPDGPRQWVCPLAVIDWAQRDFVSVSTPEGVVHDCRVCFDNLVTLTGRRLGGCCTVTVWPSDAPRLQALIDRASRDRRRVTVCLMPGSYPLSQPLRFTSQHSHLVLESCSGGAILTIAADTDPLQFVDGLIVIVGANQVSLRGLRIVPSPAVLPTPDAPPVRPGVIVIQEMAVMIGVRAINCLDLTVEDCSIAFPADTPAVLTLFGVGLFAGGDCTGLTVQGCRFESAVAPTVNVDRPQPTLTERVAPQAVFQFLQTSLFGVLAIPQVAFQDGVPRKLLPCVLDRVSFRDNDFNSLTLPLVAWGQFGSFKVRDNRMTYSVGGVWLLPINAALFRAGLASKIQEVDNGLQTALTYPLPGGVNTISIAALTQGTATAAPTESVSLPPQPLQALILRGKDGVWAAASPALWLTTVSILNNRIEALLSAKVASGTGTVALLVLVSWGSEALDPTTSLVITSNIVYGRPAGTVVTRFLQPAVVQLAVNGPTTVTGNVFMHGTQGDGVYSLEIVYRNVVENGSTSLLAVSGNVFRGNTNLQAFKRIDSGTAPLDTWMIFNSVNFLGGNLG